MTIVGKDVGEVYVQGGIKAYAEAKKGKKVECTNLTAYVFAEMGAKLNITKNINYTVSYEFINKDNTPLMKSFHFEDGKQVNSCSEGWKNPVNKVGGGSYGGGGSGGYVSGYGYGTGYAGYHGPAWLSKYYSATMAFSELEPALVISEDRILTDDLDVDTAVILRAKLDLNGHKLTVGRDLTLDRGESNLVFNKGTAVVKGDFIGSSNDAYILMENAGEKLTVEGDTRIECTNSRNADRFTFKAGTVEFKGNVVNTTIRSTDTNLIILSGSGDQSVGFTDYSTVRLMEIKNSDSRTINVTGAFYPTSSTTIDGKTLKLKVAERSVPAPVGFGKITADKITIDGNFGICSTVFNVGELVINGNISEVDRSDRISNQNSGANVTFTSCKATVNGDYITMQRCVLDNSQLTVTGDFSAYQGQLDWIAGTNGGNTLTMNNRNDSLKVGGDLYVSMANTGVTDGVIDVKGKLTMNGAAFGQNCNVILSSDKDQSVSLTKNDAIKNMEIKNSGKKVVYMDNYFRVSNLTSEEPITLISRSANVTMNNVQSPEFTVQGDVNFFENYTLKLCSPKNVFEGDVTSNCKFSLKDSDITVDVKGTFYNNESIILNEGTMNVENLENTGTLKITGGKLNIAKNFKLKGGSIIMENKNDLIDIKGNLTVTRTSGTDILTSGTIRLAGNLEDGAEYGLLLTKNSKLVLTGEKDQELYYLYTYFDEEMYHCATLEVLNSDKRNIIVPHALKFGKITADTDTVNIKTVSDDSCRINGTLECNINIDGDLYSGLSDVNLNGYTLNVSGSYYLNRDDYNDPMNVNVGTGKLLVGKDLVIGIKDGSGYVPSYSSLVMTNDKGYVSVGGDFITMAATDQSANLTAGTLEIKGNFYQYADGTTFAFPASGTHKTILSGSDVQNVTFESYPDSHFNIIDLKQDKEQYVFSDDPCWESMAGEVEEPTEPDTPDPTEPTDPTEPDDPDNPVDPDDPDDPVDPDDLDTPDPGEITLGDVNGDGSIDLKDVVLIRKFYTGGWDIKINEIAADVNRDGSIDMKDVVLIRRYYSGGWDVTFG